jgi:hypothetical protein
MPTRNKDSVPGFVRSIQVDRRLVRLLSDSTYTSFANCLRELAINAYDADANTLKIEYDVPPRPPGDPGPRYEGRLVIEDDGRGMSQEDFQTFTRIAPARHMHNSSPTYDRPIVGRFGIGYLAAFPFCESLTVETTQALSMEEIEATFPCHEYMDQTKQFRPIDEVEVQATVRSRRSRSLYHRQRTRLTLNGLTRQARDYLVAVDVAERARAGRKVDTIWHWPGDQRLRWQLGLTLPIPWTPPGSPKEWTEADHYAEEWEVLLGMNRSEKDPGFRVYLDGELLQRPWPAGRGSSAAELHCLNSGEKNDNIVFLTMKDAEELVGHARGWPKDRVLKFRWLILTPTSGTVEPDELRGILLRLRKVALGLPIPFNQLPNVVKLKTEVRSYWEIHLLDGFDELITLDRSSLKQSIQFNVLMAALDMGLPSQASKPPVPAREKRDVASKRKTVATGKPSRQRPQLFKRVTKATKALSRLETLKKQLASPGSNLPLSEVMSEVGAQAKELEFKVKTDARLAPGTLEIDHRKRTIRVSKRLRSQSILLDEKQYVLEVADDESSSLSWVRLDVKKKILHISARLRREVRGETTLKYRQLISRLAHVELRRVQALQGERNRRVRKAVEEFARAVMEDLVEDSR